MPQNQKKINKDERKINKDERKELLCNKGERKRNSAKVTIKHELKLNINE